MLTEVFGGGTTSRLYRALVVEGKLAVSAGTYYGPNDLGPSSFTVYASPRPGVSMESLEAAVEAEIEALLRDGVTEPAVERAKHQLQVQAVYARDSLRAGARALGAALAIGRTIEDVETWPERIGAVTVEAVAAAARSVLAEERSVTALLLSDEATP